MDTLTADMLAQVLAEPEKALLARCLRQLGQERCAQVLAATMEVESGGGMPRKDGGGRKSPGGTFFQLVKDACTGRERYYLFRFQRAKRPSSSAGDRPPTSSVHRQAPPAQRTLQTTACDQAPVTLTLDQWKGLRPMSVTATLKLVLRDIPETRESGGMVFMALTNEPRGVPGNISLDAGPLFLASPSKPWKTACTKAAEIRATGIPALLIVEAHVSTREGALIGVVKGVQVVEGKAPAQAASTA